MEKQPILTEEQTSSFYSTLMAKSEIKHTKTELKITYRELNHTNVQQLRILLGVTLPVVYHKNFYERLLDYSRYSRLAYFKDILIGAITCKEDYERDENDKVTDSFGIYLMTITVLKPYRRYGVGSQMLRDTLKHFKEDTEHKCIFLDVQANNKSALEFYKKHDFDNVRLNKDYYTNIMPADSYYLRKILKE